VPTHPQSRSKAAETVQRQLARYRAMRDFHITPEPSGKNGKASGRSIATLPFVIQKHAATRLHYDFRLGWHGVLKSWAVTKGPSYNPADKRLAVQVEDHPMEYGGFEGTIPKGQYGGGTVMVWDFGEWTPLDDVDSGLAKGHLKFELHGKKLQGRWALVRMHGRGERPDKPNWLLIKDRDEFARSDSDPAITDAAPDSAMTSRSIEQIAESADTVWDSRTELRSAADESDRAAPSKRRGKAAASSGRNGKSGETTKAAAPRKALPASGPRESFPGFIPPQLAQSSASAPSGDGWVHELKLDGYRIQIHIHSRKLRSGVQREATLLTRKGLDWTERMPDIARAASELPVDLAIVDQAILDGEVVALNNKGIASFADLQAAFQEGQQRFLVYFAFDLLHLNGHNTRELPLIDRKALLQDLLTRSRNDSLVRYSEHFLENGSKVFAHACRLGAEGIVSKLSAAKYMPGRGNGWLKTKCVQEQELVIGGFTPPSKGGQGIGALLLGYYQDGRLIYAGRSGTGFTDRSRRAMRTRLDKLMQKKPPFAQLPPGASRDAIWVKPELVAQIAFATWTRDNLVRQASFKGLREDKPAREVERETPEEQPALTHAETRPRKRLAAQVKENDKDSKVATQFHITHPDRILDRESGMTKLALAEYFFAVAERMLPHVADRPLSVVRCPEGSDKPCFFQKHVGRGLPAGVESIPVKNRKTGVKEDFLTLHTAEGLVGMAQMGVLEIHPWGSRNETLEQPDRIVFDLDPDAAIDWATLAAAAADLRKRLSKLHLTTFLKSTGGKGLHVVIPIEPEHEWPVIKRFAHEIVLKMEAEQPDLYITRMTKAERKNRIYLDYLRNDREATSVAPFSPRARSGAPVSITLGWNELKTDAAPVFQVANFAQWRSRLNRDPWKEMVGIRQRLTEAMLNEVSAMGSSRSRKR
jgi:bifunctional non-homologous end joining protein LigD